MTSYCLFIFFIRFKTQTIDIRRIQMSIDRCTGINRDNRWQLMYFEYYPNEDIICDISIDPSRNEITITHQIIHYLYSIQYAVNRQLYYSCRVQMTGTQYQITLRQNFDITDIPSSLPKIFSSFNLPSWLGNDYDVRIIYQGQLGSIPYYEIEAKESSKVTIHQVHLWFFVAETNYQNKTIKYYINQQFQYVLNNEVNVSFKEDVNELKIIIDDTCGVFETYFEQPEVEMFAREYSSNKDQLEYRYIEPLNKRTKEEKQVQHFHLAFQGGGIKGLAYIGAYKALRDMYPHLKINSVIGASAGAIIALAIAADTHPNQLALIFQEMEGLTKDVTVKNLMDITPEKSKQYAQMLEKLKRALHDYGIVHQKITQLFADNILNNEVIDKIISYICGENQSLRNMFTIEVEQEVERAEGCCSTSTYKRVNRLVNYYGLLEGKLMSGDEFEKICIEIIREFLGKLSQQQLSFITQKHRTSNLKELSRKLTMAEFYQITKGLEFTCTAVDLQSKIVRLFNHKTTPDLPVCKAVRMSGSFPIAFQAQIWQQSYGKYYIHYEKKRREVNLAGHQFTDGGMLANFPIIYLDNEHIRPMYFSHKPNEKTKLFGFGVEHKPRQQTKQQLELEALRKKQMVDAIYKHLPLLKFIAYQLWYTPSSPQVVPSQQLIPLKSIPFVGFLIDIMSTYIQSNDNFTKQCFARKIYFFDKDVSFGKLIMTKNTVYTVAKRGFEITEKLQSLLNRLSRTEYSLGKVVEYLDNLKSTLSKDRLSMNQLITIKQSIISYLRQFSIFFTMYKQAESSNKQGAIQFGTMRMITELQEICTEGIFIKSESLKNEQNRLELIVDRLLSLYRKHTESSQHQCEYEQFFVYMKKKEIQNIANVIEDVDEGLHHLHNNDWVKYYHKKFEVIKAISILKSILPNHGIKEYSDLSTVFTAEEFPLPLMIQSFFSQRESIKFYIRSMLINKTSPNIHLVFQSKGTSISLYLQIYKFVNEYLFMQQNTKSSHLYNNIARRIIKSADKDKKGKAIVTTEDLVKFIVTRNDLIQFISKNLNENFPSEIDLGYIKYHLSPESLEKIKSKIAERKEDVNTITSITCSNIHSFLGFMIAAGMNEEKIHVELELLKDDFETDSKVIEEEFKKLDWILPTKVRIREFQEMIWQHRYKIFEEIERANSTNSLQEQLEIIKEEFQESREQIYQSFNDIIQYITKTVSSSETQGGEEYVGRNLSIKFMGMNFNSINKQISKSTKEVMSIFLNRYYEQIRYFVMSYSSQDVLEIINLESDLEKKEAMWKGIIINNFLKGDKFKFHVQRLLKSMNLPRNIKLKEFYDISSRKIELTFTAVELHSRKVVFINHNSYPEMPLWAAIVISSSFPILFPEIRGQYEWLRKVERTETTSNNNFFQEMMDPAELPLFISGNLIGSLPLQLLTNKKVRQLYFGSKQYTFLCFAFKTLERKYNDSNRLVRSYLTFCDILKLGYKQTVNNLFGISKLIEFGSNFIAKQSMISTFMWCHDELIVQLYDKCLLKLPVEFGTLDFYKLKSIDNDGRAYSETTIERSYYITRQKFSKEKSTYIQVVYYQDILKLHFLSKQNTSLGDFVRKYKIEYKTEITKEYHPLQGFQIVIQPTFPEIYLKFYYVSDKTLKIQQRQYRIQFRNILTSYTSFQGIYKLYYSDILNGLLYPIIPHTGKLSHYLNQHKAFKLNIKSIVDIKKHGLYCQHCCHPLSIIPRVTIKDTGECQRCDHLRVIKFSCCRCKSGYCMICCKGEAIRRTKTKLVCSEEHEFEFQNQPNPIFRGLESKLKMCDICMSCVESCYWDKVCNIQICQSCCSQFILQ